MDIYCATCQEPWEAYYLLNDVVWEIWDGEDNSSTHLLIEKFLKSPKTSIPQMLREDLAAEGWVFGRTIVCVLSCGCCSSNAAEGKDPEKVSARKAIRLEAEDMLGDDLDGLISALSGIDRYTE